MKKFLLATVMMVAFASCDMESFYEPHTNKRGITEQAISTNIDKITIEGHEYLKFTETVYGGCSIAVVHSASCPCHDKKEEEE